MAKEINNFTIDDYRKDHRNYGYDYGLSWALWDWEDAHEDNPCGFQPLLDENFFIYRVNRQALNFMAVIEKFQIR